MTARDGDVDCSELRAERMRNSCPALVDPVMRAVTAVGAACLWLLASRSLAANVVFILTDDQCAENGLF